MFKQNRPFLTSNDPFGCFQYHFWNQNKIRIQMIGHMTYFDHFLFFDLVWPQMTWAIVFPIIFELETKFGIDWYVTWPISTIFKFLTTPDHSLVGRGDSKQWSLNSLHHFTYEKVPLSSIRTNRSPFRAFRPKVEKAFEKRLPGRILINEFLHRIPEGPTNLTPGRAKF